jgi:hypothetical protein
LHREQHLSSNPNQAARIFVSHINKS